MEPLTCRVCGCTDDDCSQCIAKTGEPCHWVERGLCSACVVDAPNRKKKTPEEKEQAKRDAIAARLRAHQATRRSHKEECRCGPCSQSGIGPCSPEKRCSDCRRRS